MSETRTITIKQAQAAAGVSRRTIYNWMASGKLEYLRTAGGAVRIYEASLWRPADYSTSRKALAQARAKGAAARPAGAPPEGTPV